MLAGVRARCSIATTATTSLRATLSALSLLTTLFIGYWNEDLDLALWIIYMYITYRQLFDYGWWGTLWRFAVLLQLAVTTMLFAAVSIKSVYDHEDISGILLLLVLVVVLDTTILYVTHRINKRTYRNNNKEIISNL